MWEITPETLQPLFHNNTIYYPVTFSPNNQVFFSTSENKIIKLRDIATGNEISTFSVPIHDALIAASQDGKIFASDSNDGTVKLWEISTGRELFSLAGHTGFIMSLVFSPNSKYLASNCNDGTIKLWEVSTGKLIYSIQDISNSSDILSFSPDGKFLAYVSIADDSSIILCDANTGIKLHSLPGTEIPRTLVFSSDSKVLASGVEGSIKLWEVAPGKLLTTLKVFDEIRMLAFSPDNKTLTSIGLHKTIKLWEAASEEQVALQRGKLSKAHQP